MQRVRYGALIAGFVLVALPARVYAELRPPAVLRVGPPSGAADFGAALAGLGDVNGDGTADVAVGAPSSDHAYMVSGATRSILRDIASPAGAGLSFGFAVAAVGDVDGDGVPDLAVGAPADPVTAPPCGPTEPCAAGAHHAQGRAFLFSGASGALLREPTPAAAGYSGFGRSVTGAGDLSGDGTPDVVVGAPVPEPGRGAVFAFSGRDGALLWSLMEPSEQPEPLGSFGEVVVATPDVSGDGVDDLLATAPSASFGNEQAGRVHVLSGRDGAVLRSIDDAAPHDNDAFGGAVVAVGDQDGDGVADHLVAEGGANQLHLYSGRDGRLVRSIAAPAQSQGPGALALAHVDDKDGDGRDDVWVGVPAARTAHLVNGMGAVLAVTTAPSTAGTFGATLSAIVDIGGDRGADVVVGDPTEPGGGAVYVVHTRPNDLPVAGAGSFGTTTLIEPTTTTLIEPTTTTPPSPATATLPKPGGVAAPADPTTRAAAVSATAALPKPAGTTTAEGALAGTGGSARSATLAGLCALLLGTAAIKLGGQRGLTAPDVSDE